MEEGLVVEWLVDEGEEVKAGDPVVLIETDKMTSEVTTAEGGALLSIEVPAGQTVSIGTVLGYIGSDPSAVPAKSSSSTDSDTSRSSSDSRTVRASPDAKRKAREAGVSVESVGNELGVTQVRGEHVETFVTDTNGSSEPTDSSMVLGSPYAKKSQRTTMFRSKLSEWISVLTAFGQRMSNRISLTVRREMKRHRCLRKPGQSVGRFRSKGLDK
jgi:pyruvate/2-oxoglutarate dehydrogenase complex dihydrolipoamide acyltransferase (E2) component